MAGTKEFMDSG